MKGFILLFCAFAQYTISVYGVDSKDEMSDVEIVQNSTIIPKDIFQIIPVMSDTDANRDDTDINASMDQNGKENKRVDYGVDHKSVKDEAPNALLKFGFDSKPTTVGSDRTMETTQKYTKSTDKNQASTKPHASSKTTTSTAFPIFMAPQYNQNQDKKQKDKKHRHGHQAYDIEMNTTCKQVSVKVPSTCYKDETLEIPYKCHKDVVKQECKMVEVDVVSTCQRTEYNDEQYPCQKTRNVCRNVMKQCERIEYKDEEYVCSPATCKLVKKLAPSRCTRKTKVKVPVPCPPPKKCKKIKMIDQSYQCGTRPVCTNEIKSAVCYRNVQVDEEYECLKQSEKTLFNHFGKSKKHDSINEIRDENTDDIIRKEGCSQVTIQVPSECTKSVVEKKPYSCFKTEEKQVCKNVTVRVPGVCTKSTPVDEVYDCEESSSMDSVDGIMHGRVCQDEASSSDDDIDSMMFDGMDSISNESMRKNRQLKKHSANKKSKCKKACKVRKVMKEEPYKCEKTQVVKECNTVPTQVQSTCFEEQTVEKKYTCSIPKTVEKCERVYTRCTRKKTISEPYTCEKTEKKCTNVPQTCFKKVPFEYEEDCFKPLRHLQDAKDDADDESPDDAEDESPDDADDESADAEESFDDTDDKSTNDRDDARDKDEARADGDDESLADRDDKARADRDDKTRADRDDKTRADRDDKTRADRDDKTRADRNDKTRADRDDKTRADRNDKTRADRDDEARADRDDEARADRDDEARDRDYEIRYEARNARNGKQKTRNSTRYETAQTHKHKSHTKKQMQPQVCTETVEQDEEYECKKPVEVEECSKEKLCKRRVAVPTFEECTQRVCQDVQTRSTCSRKVPIVVDYECTKKDRVQQCEDKTHKTLSTCIKTITKPKPYLCTETQQQTICTGPKKK